MFEETTAERTGEKKNKRSDAQRGQAGSRVEREEVGVGTYEGQEREREVERVA